MENCLMTKLKSVVQNENLPLLNDIIIKLKSGNSSNTQIITGLGLIPIELPTPVTQQQLSVELLTTDDTEWKRGGVGVGKSVTYSAGQIPVIIGTTLTNEMKVKIGKKDITAIGYTSGDSVEITDYGFEKWGYMESLAYLEFKKNSYRGEDFNISIFRENLPSLQYLDSAYAQFTCKELAQSIPSLKLIVARGMYGNIEDLASILNLQRVYTILGSSATYGDFKTFVDRKRSLYSTSSGTIRFNNALGTNIKFNNASIEDGHDYNLVWDTDSIILKDIATASNKIAYTYGASAAQISELENAGYTVTQVD